MERTVENFDIQELVCPHVYNKLGERAWDFMDERLRLWLRWFRKAINKPVTVNDYDEGGTFDERGYRCILCPLVKEKSDKNVLYASAHTRFQAVDFSVQGMVTSEIIAWIEKNKRAMPVKIRIEMKTNGWVHVDVCNTSNQEIIYFNP